MSGIAVLFLAGLFVALRPSGEDEDVPPATSGPAATSASSGMGTEASTEAATETETETETDTETTATTGEDETAESGPTRIRITVAGGRPAGGIVREAVPKGADVLLVVRADAPETVHLHGYDREAPVGPNAPAQIGFKADQPGRFEVELEESGVLIAEISVEP